MFHPASVRMTAVWEEWEYILDIIRNLREMWAGGRCSLGYTSGTGGGMGTHIGRIGTVRRNLCTIPLADPVFLFGSNTVTKMSHIFGEQSFLI